MRILKLGVIVLASSGLFVSCADDSGRSIEPPKDGVPPLARNFDVVGVAAGDVGELSIECDCALTIELDDEPGSDPGVEYTGVHGGGLRRTVLLKDGSGISLEPDVFGDVIVRVLSSDSIQLVIPANEGTGSRFWDNLAILRGARTSDNQWEGEWLCAPFDISEGGWVDTVGTVPGTWRIVLNGDSQRSSPASPIPR